MALAQALLTNPDLGQFSYDIRSAEARTLQAGYRPNPEISVLSEDFGGSRNYAGFQGSQTTLSLSQLVELGGKRAARLRVARLDESLAAWNYEGQRLDVLTATTRAFVDVVV
ncbi:MAG: TolC family protein, partial [Rhodospirillales bacterium]|nr:TolC family protein [Rhodospirillales bacterium]